MKTQLQTKGMHCKSCELLVADTLEDAGATNVEANHKTGTIVVEHDKTLSVEKIISLIQEEGYEVLQ